MPEEYHRQELEQWAASAPPIYGRKLTFSEKCGIAYFLAKNVDKAHATVAKAFNLSVSTVSMLANALDPNGKRYRDVWAAFYELGEETFADRYYTPDLHFRLKRVRLELTHLADGQDVAPKQSGPDPRAAKYQGEHVLPDNSQWAIALHEGEELPRGWYFRLLPDGPPHGAERVRGALGHEPFRTSSDAFDAVYEINGYDSPRPKPGRPRK